MGTIQDGRENWDELKSSFAQNLARSVDLPHWAAKSFTAEGLAVLDAIRDVAYNSQDGACSIAVGEIARMAGVSVRTAIKAITLAIAAGIIERDGQSPRAIQARLSDHRQNR